MNLKGQCLEIFHMVFCHTVPPGPIDMPRNDFNCFRIFEELFVCFYVSPVSLSLAEGDPGEEFFIGVVDTSV
jgi:hypothetical protein